MNKRKLDAFLQDDVKKLWDKIDKLPGLQSEEITSQDDTEDSENEWDSTDNGHKIKKYRKVYDKDLKDEAIRLAKSLGVEYVSDESKIPVSNIKRWIKYGTTKKKKTGRPITDLPLNKN